MGSLHNVFCTQGAVLLCWRDLSSELPPAVSRATTARRSSPLSNFAPLSNSEKMVVFVVLQVASLQ